MKKKKVLYILHDLKIGGVETALLSALPILVEKYEFRLLCLGVIDDKIKEALSSQEIQCIKEFKPYNIFAYIKAASFILNFSPEIMIASLWRSNLLASMVSILKKNIFYVSFKHSTRMFHKGDALSHYLSLKRCNEAWADSLSTSLFVNKSIKNGRKSKIISFIIRKVSYLQRDFNTIDTHKFLFVGRITYVKRIDLIIRFAKELSAKNIKYEISIYGPDEDHLWEKEFSDYITTHKLNIDAKGPKSFSEVLTLYSKYHYYIQLSDFEGMAISVVEAMMSGLICFVTPVGEIARYSQHLKNAIHLVDNTENNWQEFIDQALDLLHNTSAMSQISYAASNKWVNAPVYKDDLCFNIDRVFAES